MNNDHILYIPPDALDYIFSSIQKYLQKENDPVPEYDKDPLGCSKIVSVLKSIQHSYYPNFYSKSAYLFLAINKGHYFINGNKRLAAVMLKIFYTLNGYKVEFNRSPVIELRDLYGEFINIVIENIDINFFDGDDQLSFLYTLAKATATIEIAEIGFDQLKKNLELLLEMVLVRK